MKITDIKCYVTERVSEGDHFRWRNGLTGGGSDGTPAGGRTYSSILKVETDAGVVGMASGRGRYLAEITRRRFKPLIGLNPLLTERLWHEIWEIDRLEELQAHSLAAIDIACWDIKSRHFNAPLYQMLGGWNPKVPAYASTVTWNTMDEYERHIKQCIDVGFKAFKLHAWGDAKADAKLSRNLRKWCGDDADLMFDGSAGWDYVTSLWFGRVLEACNFLWYEEPMREFDLPSYQKLCENLDIPVLAAETSDGVHWNMATWIQYGALDMCRTNVGFKGGFTGALKIAHLAESHGMRAQVHGMSHANLHLCAAIPNNDYYEQLVINSEQIAGLKDLGDLAVIDGYVTAPDTPGVQPQPDWDKLAASAVEVV